MDRKLRIILLEDEPSDAEIIQRELRNNSLKFDSTRIETKEAFIGAIKDFKPDIILADYSLPSFNGLEALEIVKKTANEIPFVFVSGTIGEEYAIEAVKLGGTDYVLKNNLQRLCPAIQRALKEKDEIIRRKNLEDSLIKSEELYRGLVEDLPGFVDRFLPDGALTFVNDTLCRYFGKSREEMIGKNFLDYLPEENRELIKQKYLSLSQDNPVLEIETSVIVPSGEKVHLHWIGRAVAFENGKPVEFQGVGMDLTSRKKMEDRQAFLINILKLLNSPDNKTNSVNKLLKLIKDWYNFDAIGIRIKDDDNDFPLYEAYGYSEEFMSKEKSLLRANKNGSIIYDKNNKPELDCICGAVLRGNCDLTAGCFTDKGSFWMNSISENSPYLKTKLCNIHFRNACQKEGFESSAIIPLRSSEEVIGLLHLHDRKKGIFSDEMVSFFEDVAASIGIALDRKLNEEKLRKYSERLEELVVGRTNELSDAQDKLIKQERLATLGQLAGGVSHELRNPLGAIKNAAYFLNMAVETNDEDVREMLNVLNQETETAERIINSMLDFARPRPPIRQLIKINNLLNEVITSIKIPSEIKTETNFADNLPEIMADSVQVGRVFNNIIRNGVQAMPGGGTLIVETCLRDNFIEVNITDTGQGIPDEVKHKIFEPLFSMKAKGIGLGLAVTKNLLERHQGTISFESELGKGTIFNIRIPVNRKI